jgi:Zn-dependent protease/CBS domain-containing protein
MKSGIRIGTIINIPIELHASWFLIFGLLTWSLAAGLLPQEYPELSSFWHWLLGGVTSILFFGSVLAHELGHSVLALRNKVPVRKITLFIFGGLAQIEKEPPTPGAEFRIAIAGPLTSLGLAAVFGSLWLLDQAIPYLAAPSIWLARINLILAVFNMIPGFPLDGGRVLRAAIWQWKGSYNLATRIAASVGQLVAFGFIGFGLFEMFMGRFMDGLWLVFIGTFLNNAASNSATLSNLQETLKDVTVADVMPRKFLQVSGLTTLQRLVDDYMISGVQPFVFVGEGGDLRGVLTLQDITAFPSRKWPFTTAAQAMSPVSNLPSVSSQTELWQTLQMMETKGVSRFAVVDSDEVVGAITRDQIQQYLRVRSQLGL